MDDFYNQTTCDRCGGTLDGGRTVSMFNMDCICMSCKDEEKKHPDYHKAVGRDHEAIANGNYNFSGIGYPGDSEKKNEKLAKDMQAFKLCTRSLSQTLNCYANRFDLDFNFRGYYPFGDLDLAQIDQGVSQWSSACLDILGVDEAADDDLEVILFKEEAIQPNVPNNELMNQLFQFKDAYFDLLMSMEDVDIDYSEKYPFSASFGDLTIAEWAESGIDSFAN